MEKSKEHGLYSQTCSILWCIIVSIFIKAACLRIRSWCEMALWVMLSVNIPSRVIRTFVHKKTETLDFTAFPSTKLLPAVGLEFYH